MTYPADSVQMGYQNHVEDIRSFLDSRHADHYTVFNLSQRNYRGAKFSNRVSECSHLRARQGQFCLHRQELLHCLPANVLSSPARCHDQIHSDSFLFTRVRAFSAAAVKLSIWQLVLRCRLTFSLRAGIGYSKPRLSHCRHHRRSTTCPKREVGQGEDQETSSR